MKLYTVALLCASLIALPMIAQKMGKEPEERVRVVAVDPTPEPETVVATIQLPRQGQVLDSPRVFLQIRVDGYSLGSDSQFPRASEVANSRRGQTIHVVVDDNPYFLVDGPSIEPFNEDGWYYNQNYRVEIPGRLSQGLHTIRVFPARSFGESLKGDKNFHASYFFVQSRERASEAEVLSRPYLTYNEPSDQIHLVSGKPVLLDFYLSNAELSPDGYKVRLAIDGKIKRTLTSWQPYYIYGLDKGRHTIQLQLVDAKNKEVPGPFNSEERTITIY